MRPATPLWFLSLCVFAIGTCAAPTIAASGDAENSGPRIAVCRIGFAGYFKTGYWTPVWVDLTDNSAGKPLRVEVTTQDSDGVEVTVPSDLAADIRSTCVYIPVGLVKGRIRVSLVSTDGQVHDRFELVPGPGNDEVPACTALPATSQLFVHVGPTDIGLVQAVADRDVSDAVADRYVAHVAEIDELPTEWIGYDGVDVLILTTGDASLVERLAADERRFEALRRWVEMGGRLVIGCGQNAAKLIAADSRLAALVPGKFAELLRLPQTRTVESYAANATAIGQGPVPATIAVPRLTDVRGRVELYGQGDNLPLVIRAAQGFGEVAFVGLDVDLPPLADWPGRPDLLRAVLQPYLIQADAGTASQTLVSSGFDDLAGALRQRLGRRFAGVIITTFPVVAAAIIAYLLFLGPLDFLFVHNLVRRPSVAWMTFPLVVLLTCGAAAWWTRTAKESAGQRLNAVELTDFDLTTGLARGTCWATLYSPQAERYDLTIDPRLPGGATATNAKSQLSNWGLPGAGVGGMHANGLDLDVVPTGYRISPALDELQGVPILTASTKSLLARWERPASAEAEPLCEAQLSVDDDGTLVGTVTNQTGALLRDACLLYGQWGYALGDLRPGARVEVGPDRTVNRIRTTIIRRARRISGSPDFDLDRDVFLAERASIAELLNVMMFYEAVGGYDFVGLPNRFQSFTDMSRLLELDRAVLVADGSQGGSRWMNGATDEPARVEDLKDARLVIYRFVFPVASESRTTAN